MARKPRYGSIEKRGTSSYRVRLGAGGQRRYISVKGTYNDALRVAEREGARMEKEAQRRKNGLLDAIPVLQLLDEFAKDHIPTKRPGTQSSYRDSLKPLRVFFKLEGDPLLNRVTRSHVKRYLKWRRRHGPNGEALESALSNRTLARDRAILHVAFGEAVQAGYIDFNPVTAVKAPKIEKRTPVILSNEEFEKLLEACEASNSPMLSLFVLTCYESGARSESEVLWLRFEDVKLDDGFLRIGEVRPTKSGEPRWTPMSPRLVKAMRDHFAAYRFKTYDGVRSEWIFHHVHANRTAEAGSRITSMRQGFKRAAKRAELPDGLRQHDLRHMRITRWLAEGADVVKVKEAVGHADLATTMQYTHLAREHLRDLVEPRSETRTVEAG